ncbi:ABC transporter substrate-binding protein [Brevibacillus fluminis]|uniref:ABC transporter substrate-binding protein n=1 Tax=Brevibacillus fluminis TaxID=511487 RepID=A0A3M8DQ95_9BACL|nr:ABC transporter substrate-binding protein [Brevibacillus fluminis]RNB90300.1 ABC transporter substrate-binding protein [Brevibacillus fluminis]
MKMAKKAGTLACVLAVGLTTLMTGCATKGAEQQAQPQSSGNSSTQTSAQPASTEPVKLDFWYAVGGAKGKKIEEMVKKFNESHPGIVVKAAYQGSYAENHSKVLAAVAAGNQPDITMVEIASIGAFADAKVLTDLGPYSQGEESKYIDGLMKNSYWKDKLYAVPFNRSTPIMYVNQDMLKAAGLNPEGPKSWDELKSFSSALAKKEGGKNVRYGFSTPVDIWFYEASVFESGGTILSEDGKQVTLDNEAGKAPIALWSKMVKDGSMKNPPGEGYDSWDVAEQDFLNQKVGLIYSTTGSLGELGKNAKFKMGTAFLPANKNFGVPTGGANLVILAKSTDEEKKASWEFLKWMTDTPQTVDWSIASGYMPVTKEAVDSSEMKAFYDKNPNFKVAVDQLQYGYARPMVPGYKELQDVIQKEVQRAMLGQSTPDEAMKAITEKGEKLLKK